MIVGAFSSAALKRSLTNLGPSPKYLEINSDPTILKKVALVSFATALASKVFPVPGGPYKITPNKMIFFFYYYSDNNSKYLPLGGLIPMSSYISG